MIFGTTYALLWLLALFQALVICVLVRQLADLRRRAEAGLPSENRLPLGSTAPEFRAIDLQSGRAVHSSAFRGRRTLLCFLSADCHTCQKLAADLSMLPAEKLAGLAVYCNGTQDECRRSLPSIAATVPTLHMEQMDVATQFGVAAFPVAVMIDEAWRIAGFRYPSSSNDILSYLSIGLADAPERALELT